MLYKLIVVLFIFTSLSSNAQKNFSVKVIDKTPLKADRFIGIDNLGDTYYIYKRALHKKTAEASYVFNDFQLGNIGSVDILNPLKITLFYPDFNTAVILDNRLNEIQRTNFNLHPPFLNIANATTANNNHLWVFNIDNQQLELFNYRTQKQQTLSRPISETYVNHHSNFNFCYLLTETNIRLYNIYGSLLASMPNKNYEKLSINKERIVLLSKNQLTLITEHLSNTFLIPTTEITIKDLYLTDDFLYLYDGNFLYKTVLTSTKN